MIAFGSDPVASDSSGDCGTVPPTAICCQAMRTGSILNAAVENVSIPMMRSPAALASVIGSGRSTADTDVRACRCRGAAQPAQFCLNRPGTFGVRPATSFCSATYCWNMLGSKPSYVGSRRLPRRLWDKCRANWRCWGHCRVPLQQSGTPQQVVQCVLFFFQQNYVTGQVVVLDGGRSLV